MRRYQDIISKSISKSTEILKSMRLTRLEWILPWLTLTMLSLAGSVLVKGSLVEALAAQVQYPVCSCLVLENLTEQSLLLFPNAGNCRTGNGWVVGVAVVAIVGIAVAEITERLSSERYRWIFSAWLQNYE